MKITCFIPYGNEKDTLATIRELRGSDLVAKIFVTGSDKTLFPVEGAEWINTGSMLHGATIKAIAATSQTDYTLVYARHSPLKLGQYALERFLRVAEDTKCGLVYSNYLAVKAGALTSNPVIDYQEGSLRDDFNFGSILFYRTSELKRAAEFVEATLEHAGLYALRLNLSLLAPLIRIPEYLYTEEESDLRQSGEKIFDYVDPKNRGVQIEMEKVCTQFLKEAGAFLKPNFKTVDFGKKTFPVEASVIIPVRNRVRTIEDAIKSVLSQKTNFSFNLIIADNYSNDGTTELIEKYAEMDARLIHLIPDRSDLGIGGCWNAAAAHPACGKFSVQLDSDDLYLDNTTLQQVVDTFYREKCAMVVGSYRMVNFALEEIPPGVIDHKEWTPDNGRNNALRINGLGAPRAFYTPVLRCIKVPNVNYGEDYALGLAISRYYQIGRIYNPIYLCRRWDDNSDASLSVEVMNGHNLYKDRIRTIEFLARKAMNEGSVPEPVEGSNREQRKYENVKMKDRFREFLVDQNHTWKLSVDNYLSLDKVEERVFPFDGFKIKVQFNPERIRSSSAKVDPASIAARKCFLCSENRPDVQKSLDMGGDFILLVNPFPIFRTHFTIPSSRHVEQRLIPNLDAMFEIARKMEGYTLFYNGPESGASAPDHLHFQAGENGFMPVESEFETLKTNEGSLLFSSDHLNIWAFDHYLRKMFSFETDSKDAGIGSIKTVYNRFREIQSAKVEPMMNLLCYFKEGKWILHLFPRNLHRPRQFFAKDKSQLLISPGSVDFGGVLITPRREDFDKITANDIADIFAQVSLDDQTFRELKLSAKQE